MTCRYCCCCCIFPCLDVDLYWLFCQCLSICFCFSFLPGFNNFYRRSTSTTKFMFFGIFIIFFFILFLLVTLSEFIFIIRLFWFCCPVDIGWFLVLRFILFVPSLLFVFEFIVILLSFSEFCTIFNLESWLLLYSLLLLYRLYL